MIASKKMRTKADIAFNLCNTILMIFILICTLYPFWYVIVCSLSSISHVTNSVVLLWPDGIHLEAYKQVFRNNLVPTAYGNTILITLTGTALVAVAAKQFKQSGLAVPGAMTLLWWATKLFGGGNHTP